MTIALIQPFLWLCAIISFYVALGTGVAAFLTSVTVKKQGLGAIFGVLVLVAFAIPFIIHSTGPGGITIAEIIVIACIFAIRKFLLQPGMDWLATKQSREYGRQSILHLILMSGSFIFLIPFAWLVVTSLKEDKEMSAFPPVWIPTQQTKQLVDGEERGLVTLDHKGQMVQAAVMEEFETGDRKVRILTPAALAGQEITAPRADMKDVRHVAPVWKNYPEALKFLPKETGYGLIFLLNTLQVSALSIIGTLLSSSMVAYGFARLRWPGRDICFMILLATMMLPSAVTMMPVFLIFRQLGWIDTLKPLWVPAFFGSAFNIFLLRQFFLGIPTELEDAAKIDGCSYIMIFWRIMLPQIKPALAALTIMAFMGAWNNFSGPLIYISSPEKQPLAYALQLFQTARGGEPGLLMAASTMVVLPVLVLFFFTQRYFIQGITLTGIKG